MVDIQGKYTMAGRKPKPTAQKLLHGNPGKRPINKNEPKFKGVPVCPDWLTANAKIEWARIVVELADIGLLKATDQSALSAYCQAYARWKSAEEIVDREGQTIKEPLTNKAGEIVGYKIKRHPATIIAKDERLSMLKAASLFGFDPSSRSRVQVPDGEKVLLDDTDDDIYAPAVDSGRIVH